MTSELFTTAIKRSIAQDFSVADLLGAVDTLAKAKEAGLVIELYKIWIRHNQTNPLLYAIQFNFGVVLSDSGDLPGAREAFSAATTLNPAFLPPYINLGNVLERIGSADLAIAQWSKVGEILAAVTGEAITHKTTAMKQIGRVLETAKIEANAEDVLKRSLEINPRQRDVIQHWIALRQSQCKWPVLEGSSVSETELLESISPLSLAVYCDDPLFQLASSHNYNKHDVRPSQIAAATPRRQWDRSTRQKLRIGYVSSDLREHAVGFLMSEVFELHDPEAVETFAYYCGIAATDSTQQRFKASADHWCDINGMTDEQAAERIMADGIDILVDLNGYTKDARLKLFAMRPAPVIVNWLGFPGTIASPYHNYIVADPVTIPVGHEVYFSEKVMRLPCYQPNDRKRVIAATRPTRADAGLPTDAFVYCCFNGTQKITKPVFQNWLDILARTGNSVLWLLSGTQETNDRMRDMAEQAGIARDRLIFAPRKPNPEHLARYPLADVFLDTAPYGAHTTASDAMWMGVPVITVPGQTFASRVCASLSTSAGLSELVCASVEDYVAKAVELYSNPGKLTTIRTKLARNRDTCTLFDTPGLVRHLEALYRQMWREHCEGTLHRPDLSNLELLHQIGCEIESERRGMPGDRLQAYRQKAADRGAWLALEHDPRLSDGMRSMRPAELNGAAERVEDSASAPWHRGARSPVPASSEVPLQ